MEDELDTTDELDGKVSLELETTCDELDDSPNEDESGVDELDCNFALELETTCDELEDFTTEEESGAEELDCNVTLELETVSDELENAPPEEESETEELKGSAEELNCPLLEENCTDDELSPSDSELLFPLSPPQAVKPKMQARPAPNNIFPEKSNFIKAPYSLFVKIIKKLFY